MMIYLFLILFFVMCGMGWGIWWWV